MSKELYMAAHEELIERHMNEWCDKHPDATEEEYRAAEAEAYEKTADGAYDHMRDRLADMADALRDRAKYERDGL